MNLVVILHAADLLLWFVIAISVFYVLFFSLASLLPQRRGQAPLPATATPRFLVLFPAYSEDAVIRKTVESFLRQDYPSERYTVAVISDNMTAETNLWLASQPVCLLQPAFEKSSKAKALQYAISETAHHDPCGYDHVVILDADNTVHSDFLRQLALVCSQGYQAIQCHRTAKNADTDIAALDGLSEEINNSIFRRGHNRLGMSSALIGSGMCFDYQWFKANVGHLDSAVEDRELESLLMEQRVFIYYAEHILVMDEKVSSGENFQRQRLRWMTGQVQALFRMMPHIPRAIATANINYIDKTLQQALIPRSMLIVVTTLLALLFTVAAPAWCAKWWVLVVALAAGLFLAIPPHLRTRNAFSKALAIPRMVLLMVRNLAHIDRKNKEFLHTTHEK